jgi:hypothetical protein
MRRYFILLLLISIPALAAHNTSSTSASQTVRLELEQVKIAEHELQIAQEAYKEALKTMSLDGVEDANLKLKAAELGLTEAQAKLHPNAVTNSEPITF